MFFRNLKPKSDVFLEVTLVQVYLPVRMGHRDAEKVFISPFSEQLAAAGMGAITGFEAHQPTDQEVSGLTIHIGLTDASRPALLSVTRMLNYLGAPYGSSIRVPDAPGDPIVFGTTEGLELSIGNDVASDATSRKELAAACHDATDSSAISRGWARRENRTLFYFYGENFHDMKDRLSKVLDEDPRFSKASLRRLA